jgi:hypothetical protein
MPRANEVGRPMAAIRVKLPTKAYPHLKKLVHELDFPCSTCSSAYQQPIYRTFMECYEAGTLQPINGPGNTFTRFGLLCPECYTSPEEGPFIQNGIIDLMTIPQTYKRPKRLTGIEKDSLFEEEDDEDLSAPVIKIPKAPTGPVKKMSDLNPKTRGERPKGNELAKVRKRRGGKLKKVSNDVDES